MGAVASHCPPPDQLDRLLAEQLSDPERDAVEAHVERCSACQERLDRRVGPPAALSVTWFGGDRGGAPPEPDDDFLEQLKQLSQWAAAPASGALPSSVATADWLENGRLGQYEIIGRLGKGGMGAVYKARHVELGKVVALKVLPTGQMSEVSVARFRHEVRAIGRLEHPNIVAAYDAGQHRGVHYLVMALVDGIDLARLVERRGPLPVADACEVARQAAVGLQHASERGLVHRDVKPSNLMLARDGVVKVLDLGLSRSSGDGAAETLTAAGTLLGTADYLAPEQWEQPHAADTRADIYALGCTLYHLLAGQPPFAGGPYKTVLTKLRAHQEVPPPPITHHRPDAPAGLAAALDRMLAKDPADRFAAPAEVAEALRPFAAGSDLMRLLSEDGATAAPAAGPAADAATPNPGMWETDSVRGGRRPRAPTRARRVLPIAAATLAATGLLWVAWLLRPGAGGLPGPVARPLEITDLHVTHRDKEKTLLGDLTTSRVVLVDERVQITARLNAPAYFYLIAFNPKDSEDGIEQLCYPTDPTDKDGKRSAPNSPPGQRTDLQYPSGDRDFIPDAVGLQVFVLAASTKPLPAYEKWRRQVGTIPWTGPKVGGDWRGHFDGREFTRFPRDRGRVEARADVPQALRDLCDFFKGRPEFDAVQVIAFPVAKDQK
jgi:hypothetical protein